MRALIFKLYREDMITLEVAQMLLEQQEKSSKNRKY